METVIITQEKLVFEDTQHNVKSNLIWRKYGPRWLYRAIAINPGASRHTKTWSSRLVGIFRKIPNGSHAQTEPDSAIFPKVSIVMRRQCSLSWITLYAQLVGVSLRLEMLFEGLILELSLNVRTFCELVKYTSHLGLTVTCVKSNWFVSVILEYNMVTRQKFNVV